MLSTISLARSARPKRGNNQRHLPIILPIEHATQLPSPSTQTFPPCLFHHPVCRPSTTDPSILTFPSQSRLNEHPYSSTQNQRNGHESPSSPVKRESAPRSRSPLSHSHPKSSNGYSADPASPTNKALNLKSSPSRSRPAPEAPAREVSSKPAVSSMSSILNPEPAAAPATAPAASSVSRPISNHQFLMHFDVHLHRPCYTRCLTPESPMPLNCSQHNAAFNNL